VQRAARDADMTLDCLGTPLYFGANFISIHQEQGGFISIYQEQSGFK